jgi:hypothetical protein
MDTTTNVQLYDKLTQTLSTALTHQSPLSVYPILSQMFEVVKELDTRVNHLEMGILRVDKHCNMLKMSTVEEQNKNNEHFTHLFKCVEDMVKVTTPRLAHPTMERVRKNPKHTLPIEIVNMPLTKLEEVEVGGEDDDLQEIENWFLQRHDSIREQGMAKIRSTIKKETKREKKLNKKTNN